MKFNQKENFKVLSNAPLRVKLCPIFLPMMHYYSDESYTWESGILWNIWYQEILTFQMRKVGAKMIENLVIFFLDFFFEKEVGITRMTPFIKQQNITS